MSNRREIHCHDFVGQPIVFRVLAVDGVQEDGVNHQYRIERDDGSQVGFINFNREIAEDFDENGIGDTNGYDANGISDEVLLAVLIDRLQSFQNGEFACKEYGLALKKVEDALDILNKRSQKKIEQRHKDALVA
jgi:hypothetical protein